MTQPVENEMQTENGLDLERILQSRIKSVYNHAKDQLAKENFVAKQCHLLYLFSILSRMNIQVKSKESINLYFIQNSSLWH